MKFDNRVYDVLKWLCLIVLPAVAILFRALDGTFGWGYAETVDAVLDAVAVFIGTMIGISTKSFKSAGEADA